MNLLIVAGEPSGDLHGASLVDELRRQSPGISCFGLGGDRMDAAGVELLHHIRSLAVVGITEVLWHLRDVRKALETLTRTARRRKVDGVVLIDYPDFNLTLARRLRRRLPDVPIVYYISPQVWAWRRGRVKTVASLVDRMLVILPFEKEIYARSGLTVEFVGHPLLDAVRFEGDRPGFAARHGPPPGATWVGLLPGSRRAEVERLLPSMLAAADELAAGHAGELAFLVPVSPGVSIERYEALRDARDPAAASIWLICDDYYSTLEHSAVAAVCSGTATLETALSGTPMVVVYRTSWLTYNLAKSLVRVRDIALVNLIAGRRAVPELVQREVTGSRIAQELNSLLHDEARRRDVLAALAQVRQRLGSPGASRRAARAVLELIEAREAPESRTTDSAAGP